jgi:hypothetical protein
MLPAVAESIVIAGAVCAGVAGACDPGCDLLQPRPASIASKTTLVRNPVLIVKISIPPLPQTLAPSHT